MPTPPIPYITIIALAAALVTAAATQVGCVHYQLGHRSLYRPDIHTVHVPVFTSQSFRRELGERITEAVIKEIEDTTPYKVTSADMADSVLRGTLVDDQKLVEGLNRYDEPRILQVDLQIQYEWIDQRGQLLRQPATLELAPILRSETYTTNDQFFPEAGQSITTAQQEAIQDFAKRVVTSMQAPW